LIDWLIEYCWRVSADWKCIKRHRSGASFGFGWPALLHLWRTTLDDHHSDRMSNTSQTTNHACERSFHYGSGRYRHQACWTASRLPSSCHRYVHCWERLRRCHGSRSRAVGTCWSLIQWSCCRTLPTATDRLSRSSLPRVDDSLKHTVPVRHRKGPRVRVSFRVRTFAMLSQFLSWQWQ